jgi:hypothetical protein
MRVRKLNGYRVVFMPEHPACMSSDNWKGFVYEHIVIAEKFLGRRMGGDEVCHHLNGIRDDNRPTNILVLSRSQHTKLHAWINKGAPGYENLRKNGVNSGKSKGENNHTKRVTCKVCRSILENNQKNYCSNKCRAKGRRKVKRPSPSTLKKEMTEMSFLALGRKYGVSDNAVRKWARTYDLL